MSKKNLVTGAIILTLANLTTKILGFFYRIYMSNTIGAEGMGLYQLIMPVYMLCWSISSSGFTTTISKLTAQENAKKQYGNMGRILKQSVTICIGISLLLSVILFFSADFVAYHVLNEGRTLISLRILSLCFPFMAAGSCIRGYFFGVQDAVVPAMSQVLEQTVRIVTVFTLSALFIPMGLEYACAAAVIGIVIGELLSFLFVFLSYLCFKKKKSFNKRPSLSSLHTLGMIMAMAVPLSANKIVGSLLSTAENILIPQRLMLFGQTGQNAMSTYGMLTGMAMPLIQFPSALLMAVSVTLVPAISEATAVNNARRIKYTSYNSLLYTCIIGIGTASVFAAFPREISMAVYREPSLTLILLKLAFLCPFLYMQITLSGLLNGLGEQVFIFRNNLISSAINIAFIYFLMPVLGVDAFIAGWLLSLMVTVALSIRKVVRTSHITMNYKKLFIFPAFSVMAAGLAAKYLSGFTDGSLFSVFLCCILMLLLYIIFLDFLRVISLRELLQMALKSRKKA